MAKEWFIKVNGCRQCQRIKAIEIPVWSEYHKRFYVKGFRWIKSKHDWSSVCLLLNFDAWEFEW